MRPLTDDETRAVFEKLEKYVGAENIEVLLQRDDERFCFRLVKNRVYYVSEKLMRLATNVARDNLMALGTCIGRFTHHGNFHLTISAMEYLDKYALHKVWVKPNMEMSFLYGNNVVKSGLAKITEDIPQYAGVVVYNLADVPLGFGLAAQPTEFTKDMDPTGNVVLHQGDIGEYLRVEEEMS